MSEFNPLNLELNPICYLLALLAHHFLHVSRIRVNKTPIFLTDLRKIINHQISWKFIQWEQSFSMRTDGQRDRHNKPYICIQDLHCEKATSSQDVLRRKSLNVKGQVDTYSCPYALHQGTCGITAPLFHSYIGTRCRWTVSFTLRQILFLVSIE